MSVKNFLTLLLLVSNILLLVGFTNLPTRSTPVYADKVLVLKAKREMQLLRKGKILRNYKISLGDDPFGHKVKQGDEKTPEGDYVLDWRNAKSTCYKSLHISYPNANDRKKAKKLGVSPGGDIMLHGLYPSIAYLGKLHTNYDWTDGCIAVTNEEMDEIWKCVKNGTPIEIRP